MERGEKTEIILEHLQQGIHSGKWADTILPKEMELAEQFGVARGTVRKAFDHLVAAGIVERKKHTGTTLCKKDTANKYICSVLRSSGHFYGKIFQALQKKTLEAGYCLQYVDVYGYEKPQLRKPIQRGINSLLAIPGAENVIMDGYSFNFSPLFEKLLKKKPVFFDYFSDIKRPDDATGVLIDYYKIGRLGATYLLKCGCKHPLLILGSGPAVKDRFTPECFACHKVKLIMDGYSDVLRENGMDPMLYIFHAAIKKKFLFEQLYEIFSYPPSRPDGIFLDEDSSLLKVLKIAGECGYIPEHKLGCYNTPWSHGEGGFSFPSISISPDECAEQLLKQVLTPKDLRQDVYVAPYLNNNQ